MKSAVLISFLFFSVALSGCISERNSLEAIDESEFSFTANTLNRSEDGGAQFNLKQHLQFGPTILLWISTGCYGCHEWTNVLNAGIENGSLDNRSIVSVHRYSDLESLQSLNEVFGSRNNSTHYTAWPIAIPNQNTQVIDFKTDALVPGMTVFEAFENPVTPTLQIINQQGAIVWTATDYWPTDSSLDTVLNALNSIENT